MGRTVHPSGYFMINFWGAYFFGTTGRYKSVRTDAEDKYKGITRFLTVQIDSYSERLRKVKKAIAEDPDFVPPPGEPAPETTMDERNLRTYQIQFDTVFYDFWVTKIYTRFVMGSFF